MRKNRIVPHWKELYILEVKANILNLVLLQSLSAWLLCVITPQPRTTFADSTDIKSETNIEREVSKYTYTF